MQGSKIEAVIEDFSRYHLVDSIITTNREAKAYWVADTNALITNTFYISIALIYDDGDFHYNSMTEHCYNCDHTLVIPLTVDPFEIFWLFKNQVCAGTGAYMYSITFSIN